MIIINKNGIYEFTHKMPKNLRFRIFEKQGRYKRSQNIVELYLSAQSSTENDQYYQKSAEKKKLN